MTDWGSLLTEQRNPASAHIDEVSTLELVRIINAEDSRVADAVGRVLPEVAAVVDLVAEAFRHGRRLLYLGAGTSGRLGVLDASECPPTYSVDPEMVQGLIAGGDRAVFRAVEGAEDDPEGAIEVLDAKQVGEKDVVIGIAASGVTPWVLGGLEHARKAGCSTVFFTCSPSAAQLVDVDVTIVAEVGPEVVTGSTRMKAGTATKLVLNMITTGAMIRLGKTYGNLMVDLQPTNNKLKDRTVRILCELTGLERDGAQSTLNAAGGELKVALVMQLCGVDAAAARDRLEQNKGLVKAAVGAPAKEAS
ncbi:MAG: N-acetylmuramic acid 6-phosphate etherase [Gemmatimonadetes bacterium]|jgi:N-acetylmuramic acid 6-phosphate etherase|nr:N-acetylmuramic acid 6-phosphate etherase [Gemmatimonadota bacterium]MBT7859231.1 N-acetylmuramic acid 6-phosphate etherase [Gemmatimonadota bacterium]